MLTGSRRGGLRSAMVLLLTARPVGLPGRRAVRKCALARARLRQQTAGGRCPATAGLVLFRSPAPPLSRLLSARMRRVLADRPPGFAWGSAWSCVRRPKGLG